MAKLMKWENGAKALFFILMLMITAQAAPALGGEDPLSLEMTGHLVVFYNDDSGKEVAKLMPLPEVVEQGDIIQYDIRGENRSDKTLSNIQAGGKMPEGTTFIEGSVRCDIESDLLFSIDGGKTYANPPVMMTVKTEDGAEKKVVAPALRYTNIRFTIKTLEPGQEFKASYGVAVQ